MTYKKAPSIKHQEKQVKAHIGRMTKDGIREFLDSMSTDDRAAFDRALAEAVRNHKDI